MLRVPLLAGDVHDLGGLAVVGEHLFARLTARLASALGSGEGGRGLLDRLGHRHDPVEAGGVEQAGEGRPAAGDGDVAAGLPGPADAADEGAEAGRVHERNRRQVDEEAGDTCQLSERFPELADGVGIELADRTADGVVGRFARPGSRARRSSWAGVWRAYPARRGVEPGEGADATVAAVADVLLATDADWIADEVDAALGGDHDGRAGAPGRRRGPGGGRALSQALVMLDLQIGNMGGMATCMHLRLEAGAGRLPQVPVLMLLDRDADVFLARRSEADGWMIKPLDAFRLRRAVNALLAGERWTEGDPAWAAPMPGPPTAAAAEAE